MEPRPPRRGETPAELRGMHRALLGVAIVFFVYLIVQAALLIPVLFTRYGMH